MLVGWAWAASAARLAAAIAFAIWRVRRATSPPGRTASGSIRAISNCGTFSPRRMSARTPKVVVSRGLNSP